MNTSLHTKTSTSWKYKFRNFLQCLLRLRYQMENGPKWQNPLFLFMLTIVCFYFCLHDFPPSKSKRMGNRVGLHETGCIIWLFFDPQRHGQGLCRLYLEKWWVWVALSELLQCLVYCAPTQFFLRNFCQCCPSLAVQSLTASIHSPKNQRSSFVKVGLCFCKLSSDTAVPISMNFSYASLFTSHGRK